MPGRLSPEKRRFLIQNNIGPNIGGGLDLVTCELTFNIFCFIYRSTCARTRVRDHTSVPRAVKPSGYDPRYVFTDGYTRMTNPSTARWVHNMRRVEALGLVYTKRNWMQKWLWWQMGFSNLSYIFKRSWIWASFHLMWTKPCYIVLYGSSLKEQPLTFMDGKYL